MAQGDEFATLSSASLKEAATAAIDIVEGAADSALGQASGAFEFFESLAERNKQAIAAFRLSALEDEVTNLRNELRALVRRLAAEGKAPDRQDPMSQVAAASEFVRNIADARTVEKRTALVHATVAQFDPRKGSPATRDYWLRRVRDASEGVVALVNLLTERRQIAFFANEAFDTADAKGLQEVHMTPLPLPSADVVALETLAQQSAGQGPGQLVHTAFRRRVHDSEVPAYSLTAAGAVFASFCREP